MLFNRKINMHTTPLVNESKILTQKKDQQEGKSLKFLNLIRKRIHFFTIYMTMDDFDIRKTQIEQLQSQINQNNRELLEMEDLLNQKLILDRI